MCLFSMGKVNGKLKKKSFFEEKLINIKKCDMIIEIKFAGSTTYKCILVYTIARKACN